jgi:hypothetical protein
MGNTTDKIAGVANQAAGKVKGGGVVSSARLTSVHFILNGSGRRSRPIPGGSLVLHRRLFQANRSTSRSRPDCPS